MFHAVCTRNCKQQNTIAIFGLQFIGRRICSLARTMCVTRTRWRMSATVPYNGTHSLWGPPQCSVNDPTYVTCQDESWAALTLLKSQGKIRAIGVSNWRIPNLQRMVDKGMELPAVNQVEAHIGYVEDDLNAFCHAHGIVLQAASPLGRNMPALVTMGADATTTALAVKYNKSVAQISLRYLLDKGRWDAYR